MPTPPWQGRRHQVILNCACRFGGGWISSGRQVLIWFLTGKKEYKRNLGFNDFGRQVVIHKYSTSAVDPVDVLYDENGDGVLDEPLQTIVHDRADRKMVAAALDALDMYGGCAIAFAGDTDWHGWEDDLCAAGLELEPIIPEWSRTKYAEKTG